MSTAIIAGATGLVGGECLRLLLARYESVTALVRHPSLQSHPNLIERQIDFDRLNTIEIPPAAHVFCALGTTIKKAGSEAAFRRVDFDYPRMLAERAAIAGNARYMLVSSVGASSKSNNFYLRVKGELENLLRALPLESVHFFHPSFLMGDRQEVRSGEKAGILFARAVGPLLLGPLRKYRAISSNAVAAAMVNAAQQQKRGAFVYHYDEIVKLAQLRKNEDGGF